MRKIQLREAIEMFEMINLETRVFYNTKTGEFDYLSDSYGIDSESDSDRFEDDEWIPAPSYTDIDGYQIMVDFSETVEDKHQYELLSVALNGRGAFRRFKDVLSQTGLLDDWYNFKENVYADIVKDWCKQNGLKISCD